MCTALQRLLILRLLICYLCNMRVGGGICHLIWSSEHRLHSGEMSYFGACLRVPGYYKHASSLAFTL